MPGAHIATEKDWLDNGQLGAPAMLISAKNNAIPTVGFNGTLRYRILAMTSQEIPLGWILREFGPTGLQQGLMIRPSLDNVELDLNVRWRERVPR